MIQDSEPVIPVTSLRIAAIHKTHQIAVWACGFSFCARLLGFLIWSQSRQAKKEKAKREEMIGGLKVGDQVVTIGGLHGKIVKVGEEKVELEVAADTLLTFNASAISGPVGAEQPPADAATATPAQS